MEKNWYKICILLSICIFLGIQTVHADAGASIEGGGGSGSGSGTCTAGGCEVGGNWGFRVSLVINGVTKKSVNYANNPRYQKDDAGTHFSIDRVTGNKSKIDAIKGDYSWSSITNSQAQSYLAGLTSAYNKDFPGKGTTLFNSNVSFNFNYVPLANYFDSLGNTPSRFDELKSYLRRAFDYSLDLDEVCDVQNTDAAFLLIEPLVMVQNSSLKRNYYGTPTEIARLAHSNSSFSGIQGWADRQGHMLTMSQNTFVTKDGKRTYTFSHLSPVNRSNTTNNQTLGYTNKGWGVGLVWLGDFLGKECPSKCYDVYTRVLNGGPADCVNTNAENVTYYEEYVGSERVCTDQEIPENSTEKGIRTKIINEHCNIYCTEKAETHFPGNVMPPKTVGTHFTWPSLPSSEDLHKMWIKGEKKCVVQLDSDKATPREIRQCNSYRPIVSDLYSDFNAEVTFKYDATEYGRDIPLVKEETSSAVRSGDKITVTRIVNFKIADNTYRYVNKDNGTASFSKPSSSRLNQYTDIGYGNLPIAMSEEVGVKKNLILSNVRLGGGNKFGALANQKRGRAFKYTCTYEATRDATGCKCPPGTKYEGKDLTSIISSNSPMTCATAQQKYCEPTPDDETPPDGPPEGGVYCPNDTSISLGACLVAGNSYNTCYNRYCTGNPPEYECPRNNTEGFTEFMDITGCVETLRAKGYTERDAIKVCQDVVCPKDAEKIIYRTIDLDAPFPSKNLNGKISWANNLGLTNGRYPGYNWNSAELVRSKILNNRNAKGNALYSDQKQPIYVIDLTPELIGAIKGYNNRNSYADFKLNCKEDGSACVSDFLHREYSSMLTGGTCRNVGQNGFYTCLNE